MTCGGNTAVTDGDRTIKKSQIHSHTDKYNDEDTQKGDRNRQAETDE